MAERKKTKRKTRQGKPKARVRRQGAPLARAERPPRPVAAPLASRALFPPKEVERLRLVALTSARREDKIEALRRLAYAPIPAEEKADVFLGRLADPDGDVRVEAAQLLRTLGLDSEVAEAVRDIERGDEPRKLFAIDRLGRRMARGSALDVGAGLIALIWRLREETAAAVRRQILERLEDAAPVIAGAPERAEELARLLVSLYATDPLTVGPYARRLLRQLGERLPSRLRECLWGEHDATGSRSVRVFVLQALSSFTGWDSDDRLPPALAEEVAQAEEREIGFRILGDQLMQLGDRGVSALLAVFPRARVAQQKYIVRLLGDACRWGRISPALKENVAALLLGILAGNDRDVQMAALSVQLPADRDLSDETRRRLADAFLSHIHLFVFPSDVDNVEHTVSRAGFAAVEPLAERLGPRGVPSDRVRAARILGELALYEGESASERPAELRERLLEILRVLQRWSLEPDFPDRTAVFTAMGKVASTAALPAETVELVARNLLERRDTEGLGYRVFEALGYLAASPHVSASRAEEVERIFRAQLEAELPELDVQTQEEDGVRVFKIGPEAELYTVAVPAAVRGLARLALGRAAPPQRVASIADFLLDLWEKVSSGRIEWGPPGAGALIEALRDLASGERVDAAIKVRIVRALARKMSQLPVVEALGQVFASEDKSVDLGRIAAAAGVALLRRRNEHGQFPEEERELILRVLGKIAARKTLDLSTELTAHLREDILEELFAGLRDRVEGCYETLARLREREGLPAAFREEVARRLAAYESLVPV